MSIYGCHECGSVLRICWLNVKKVMTRRMNRIGFNWINSHSTHSIQLVEGGRGPAARVPTKRPDFRAVYAVQQIEVRQDGEGTRIAVST